MRLLIADENFNNDIVRGLLRRKPDLDIVRVQDVGLSGADDATILEWAAQENRVMLTHDVTTITKYAYERVQAGKRMPSVLRSADLFRSELRLKTFCGWSNAASKANGKARFVTCL